MNLLNKTNTKKFILAKVESMRPGWKCTRVSSEALEMLEAKFRVMIIRMVESHPTKGQTFYGE